VRGHTGISVIVFTLSSSGVAFLALENEERLMNMFISPDAHDQHRAVVHGVVLLLVGGGLQSQEARPM